MPTPTPSEIQREADIREVLACAESQDSLPVEDACFILALVDNLRLGIAAPGDAVIPSHLLPALVEAAHLIRFRPGNGFLELRSAGCDQRAADLNERLDLDAIQALQEAR